MKLQVIHDKLQYTTIAKRIAFNYDLIEVDTQHKEVWEYNTTKKLFELLGKFKTKQQLLQLVDCQIKRFYGNSVWWLKIIL